jgi:tetratricopeptide (TPR) repeat protein
MRKRLNVRLLLRSGLALLVLAVVAHAVHAWQMGRHARGQLAQADLAEKEGRQDDLLLALNRHLIFDPDNDEVRARYGLALASAARTPRTRWGALEVLREVLIRLPGRADVRRKAADLALELKQYAEAARHAEVLRRNKPDDVELQLLLARCALGQGSALRARTALESAVRLEPGHIEANTLLALLLLQRFDRPRLATQVLDRLVRRRPRDPKVYLARARYRAGHGAVEKAEEDLALARVLAPRDLDILAESASLAWQRGHPETAREHWARAVRHHPAQARAYLGLARVQRHCGQDHEALRCLRKGIKKIPTDPALLGELADLLQEAGETKAAAKVIRALRKKGGALAPLRYLDGRLLEDRERWAEAARAFEEASVARGGSPDLTARAQLGLARCEGKRGAVQRQLTAARRAVSADPYLAAARLELGSLLLGLGALDEAVTELRALVKLPAVPKAGWPKLARALVQWNLLLSAEQRDWAEVDRALARAGEAKGDAVELAILRARSLLGRDLPDEAKVTLEEARRTAPKRFEPWEALADLALLQGKPREAEKVLAQARGTLGDRPEWRIARANLALQADPEKAGPVLRRLERGLDRLPTAGRLRVLWHLIGIYQRQRDRAGQVRLCRQIVAIRPRDREAHLVQLDVALLAGDDATATRLVKALRRVEGKDGAGWRYAEAARLAQERGRRKGLGEARKLLAEARRRKPSWVRPVLLKARLDDADGRAESALSDYLKALELGARQPSAVGRAVQLLVAARRYVQADRVVAWGQQQGILGQQSWRFGAEVAVLARQAHRAVALARLAVPAGTTDFRDHLWLGSVLEALERTTEAEQAYRDAVRVEPHAPDAWVALVAHLARSGPTFQAEEALADMERTLPKKHRLLAVARCREVMNQPVRAAESYRRAVAKAPSDRGVLQRAAAFFVRIDQPRQAVPLLRRLLEPRALLPEESMPEVRRQLALLVASGGVGRAEALALLEQNRQAEGDSEADQRVQKFVQAQRPGERRPALRALEKMPGGPVRVPAERYRLAQLYDAEKDGMKARPHWLTLLEADGLNPAYLAGYVRSLAGRKKPAEARLWLEQLEKVEPDSRRTQAVRRLVRRR